VPAFETVRSRIYLSNVLVGGSVGGTLTGLYAARTRQQRSELRRQIRRLEVLNAVNVIQGYASIARDGGSEASDVIREHSADIQQTTEEVKYLTRNTGEDDVPDVATDLVERLETSVETVTEDYPDVSISVAAGAEDPTVRATDRLDQLFVYLFADAIARADAATPSIAVTVTTGTETVQVDVRDGGPELSEPRGTTRDRRGQSARDRGAGFRLNMVRLFVESYGGTIETSVEDGETTVSVGLQRRAESEGDRTSSRLRPEGVRPALPNLVVTFGAAVLAGVGYGVASELLGGSVAGIGGFYGTASPVVGWLTHEFYGVVFGFVFAGLVSLAPARYHDEASTYLAIGVAWAFVLRFGAAGVVASIWLRSLGFAASIPNVSFTLLVAYLVRDAMLGVLTRWDTDASSDRGVPGDVRDGAGNGGTGTAPPDARPVRRPARRADGPDEGAVHDPPSPSSSSSLSSSAGPVSAPNAYAPSSASSSPRPGCQRSAPTAAARSSIRSRRCAASVAHSAARRWPSTRNVPVARLAYTVQTAPARRP